LRISKLAAADLFWTTKSEKVTMMQSIMCSQITSLIMRTCKVQT